MLLWFESIVRVPILWTVAHLSLCEGPFATLQALCRDMGEVLEQREPCGAVQLPPQGRSLPTICPLSQRLPHQ